MTYIYIYVVNLLRFSMIQCNLIFFFWDLVEIKCDLMQFKIKSIYFFLKTSAMVWNPSR